MYHARYKLGRYTIKTIMTLNLRAHSLVWKPIHVHKTMLVHKTTHKGYKRIRVYTR